MAYPYVDFQLPPRGKSKTTTKTSSASLDDHPARWNRRQSGGGSPSARPVGVGLKPRSVTFKFNEMMEQERPALASTFPLTWPPGGTEYIVISDDDDDETLNENDRNNNNSRNATRSSLNADTAGHGSTKTTTWSRAAADDDVDDEREEIFKIERSFKEKLSHLTKDLGNLLSQPSHNLREFLRRREGYAPPEKSRDTSLSCVDEDEPGNHRR